MSDQSMEVYIEGDEENDLLSLFIYAPFNIKKGKEIDMLKLFNRIHNRIYYGRLVIFNAGKFRYIQTVPFNDTEPSINLIENIYTNANDLFGEWMDDITEIALTKTTFDEWDAKQEVAENNTEEAPDQL
jgi:hypothetical protein